MLTLAQLMAGSATTTATVRGVEVQVEPLSAAKSAELLGLCPSPPPLGPDATPKDRADHAQAYSRWTLAVEIHEFAAITGYEATVEGLNASRPGPFPWHSDAEAKQRWLEAARREIGGTLTRPEIQRVLRAADQAVSTDPKAVRGN